MPQLNDYDLTLGLEERVISLKARIREMKIKIGEIDPDGRKLHKLNFKTREKGFCLGLVLLCALF